MRISLKNQFGSLIGPLRTFDAIDSERHAEAAGAEIELALGNLLDADDLSRIKAIVAKYVGGGVVNGAGAARAADADSGRAAGAKVRAQVEHTQGIAKSYKTFWDANIAAHNPSIRR
jgi:hypothetical protein